MNFNCLSLLKELRYSEEKSSTIMIKNKVLELPGTVKTSMRLHFVVVF
jgi:hypothetical protein